MVWLVGWFRRRKRERLQSAWDSEWGEVDGKQWEFTNAEGLVQQWEHNVGGDIPVSKEQLDAFRELLSAWEAHSRAPQDGGPVRGFREPGSEDSVLQVRRLLDQWASKSATELPISQQQLSEFQRLLLSWEEFMRIERNREIPKSYIQPKDVRSVYYGIHGGADDEELNAAFAARLAQDHILQMSEKMSREEELEAEIIESPVEVHLANHGEQSPQEYVTSMNSDSMIHFLPENVTMEGEVLNEMWTKGLLNREECVPQSPPTVPRAQLQATLDDYQTSNDTTEYKINGRARVWFATRTARAKVATSIRQAFRLKHVDEKETRFLAPFSLGRTRQVMTLVTRQMGVRSLIVKNNGRKMKIEIPFDGLSSRANSGLTAVIHFGPIGPNATRVTFQRSKEDRASTPSSVYLKTYNAIYFSFIRLSQNICNDSNLSS